MEGLGLGVCVGDSDGDDDPEAELETVEDGLEDGDAESVPVDVCDVVCVDEDDAPRVRAADALDVGGGVTVGVTEPKADGDGVVESGARQTARPCGTVSRPSASHE